MVDREYRPAAILHALNTDLRGTILQHWPVPFAPGETLAPKTADGKEVAIDKDAPGIAATWKAVVDIYKSGNGKVRAIGVSSGCC